MSKKPHSVYVDEVVHSRLTQMIEHATGGSGSLGGFFAQLELKTYDEFGPRPKHPRVRAFFDSIAEVPYRRSDWLARDKAAQDSDLVASPEFDAYCDTPLSDVVAYAEAWQRACKTLPWSDPDISHILALRLLSSRDGLWQAKPPVSSDLPLKQSIESPYLHEILDNMRSAGLGERAGAPYYYVGFFPIAWRRGRIDFFPRDDKAPSGPASLYLDEDAHRFFYAVFGNTFFAAAEAKIDRLLSDPTNWVDISAECQFLEHGTDLFELEKLYFDPDTHADRPDLDDPFWTTETFNLLGWRVNRFPTDRIAHRLGLELSIGTRPDATGLERTFMEAFGFSTLRPHPPSAYRMIARYLDSETQSDEFRDPVEYHLFQLLRSYVLSVLQADEREPTRVALPVLATLGQSWTLPTTRALEAYSGARVTKRPEGHWELHKSRKHILSMSNTEAYHAMWALWSCVPPLVSYQQPFDHYFAVSGFDNWLEALADEDLELERSLRANRRLSFETGPSIVEDLLTRLRHGDGTLYPGFHWANIPFTTDLQHRIAEAIKRARS